MARERNKFNVDEELEQPFDIKQLKRAMIYVKRYAKTLTFAFLLSIVSILLDLCIPIYTQTIVDTHIPAKNIRGILLIGLIYMVTIAAILLVNRTRSLMFNKAGQYIITDIRHDLFSHLQKLPFDYYDSRPHGKILVRVVNYINTVANFLSNGIVTILIELVSLVAILVFMLRLHVGMTLLILTGIPLFALVVIFIKSPQRRAYQTLSNKQSNLNAYLQESISGIKVTQAFNREKMNYGIFQTLCENSRSAWLRAIRISNVIGPVILILSVFYTVVVYYVAASGTFAGVTVGVILAFVGYTARFWSPITTLGNLYNQLITNTAYLERIFQLMDEPVSIDDREGAVELPPITGRVEFKNVVFGYEPSQTVLDHVSFVAEPGESIALVGPTGAGKSTIVSLLARFYDIREGSITIDGYKLWDVTISSLRSQMGMMLQDSFLFTGTIRENIRYGRLDATDEEVEAAARAVHADDFISMMPQGYDTEVQERGASLSAGQRQLISFARTLLADPRILILDEATSSIDTQTEQLVQEGLQALLKGRTSFIIAHRLSTIKNCRILYIMDGKIVESGTHADLLAKRGHYYELYTSQLT
ncbi:MAG: ABC transporter ATP-binding protein [Eubacteriales bacterium]|mgnify:CR=1 FL=1|jgi:ATP-binding cassette subfamily B multidrug efflux pump